MVEPQPSKLMARVRFPSPAPWSYLSNVPCAHVAQSVEHFLGKEEVAGSIPAMSTIGMPSRDIHSVPAGLVFL